ncbi:hypothetical protein Dimus_009127 [Dionaea muscipula]
MGAEKAGQGCSWWWWTSSLGESGYSTGAPLEKGKQLAEKGWEVPKRKGGSSQVGASWVPMGAEPSRFDVLGCVDEDGKMCNLGPNAVQAGVCCTSGSSSIVERNARVFEDAARPLGSVVEAILYSVASGGEAGPAYCLIREWRHPPLERICAENGSEKFWSEQLREKI